MGIFNFIGNLLGSRDQRKATQSANQMNYEIFKEGLGNQWAMRDQDYERHKEQRWWDYKTQKEFAQNSSGWMLDDLMHSADEAGIHRLAALGAGGGAGYTPGAPVPGGGISPGQPMMESEGSAIGDAIGAGMQAVASARQRKADAQARKESNARIEVDKAQAELLEAQTRTEIQQSRNAARGGPSSTLVAGDPNLEQQEYDPLNPMSYYHRSGPYKGSFVIPIGGKKYVFDGHSAPKEVLEAIAGEIPSELSALYETGRASFKEIKRPKARTDKAKNHRPHYSGEYLGQKVNKGQTQWVWTKRGWRGRPIPKGN